MFSTATHHLLGIITGQSSAAAHGRILPTAQFSNWPEQFMCDVAIDIACVAF